MRTGASFVTRGPLIRLGTGAGTCHVACRCSMPSRSVLLHAILLVLYSIAYIQPSCIPSLFLYTIPYIHTTASSVACEIERDRRETRMRGERQGERQERDKQRDRRETRRETREQAHSQERASALTRKIAGNRTREKAHYCKCNNARRSHNKGTATRATLPALPHLPLCLPRGHVLVS